MTGSAFSWKAQATAVEFITSVDENNYFTMDDLKSNFWSFKFAVGMDVSILSFDLGHDLAMSNYFVDDCLPGISEHQGS